MLFIGAIIDVEFQVEAINLKTSTMLINVLRHHHIYIERNMEMVFIEQVVYSDYLQIYICQILVSLFFNN